MGSTSNTHGTRVKRNAEFDVVCHESQDSYAVFVPHPYDCGLYYECVNLTPMLMSCPSGLYFDSRINVCNWPEFVDCPERTTTSTTTTAASTTTTELITSTTTTTSPANTTTTETTANSTLPSTTESIASSTSNTNSTRVKRNAEF